jgi:hypothetical protein|tara:strand:- start:373 stop:636 length:264 start_codon:yes stop_codon:yes gene_type:complete
MKTFSINAEYDKGYAKGYAAAQAEYTLDKAMCKLYTSKELFTVFAPNFNFELDEQELVEKGLQTGFITLYPEASERGLKQFKINEDY